jgi:hypothetical protein
VATDIFLSIILFSDLLFYMLRRDLEHGFFSWFFIASEEEPLLPLQDSGDSGVATEQHQTLILVLAAIKKAIGAFPEELDRLSDRWSSSEEELEAILWSAMFYGEKMELLRSLIARRSQEKSFLEGAVDLVVQRVNEVARRHLDVVLGPEHGGPCSRRVNVFLPLRTVQSVAEHMVLRDVLVDSGRVSWTLTYATPSSLAPHELSLSVCFDDPPAPDRDETLTPPLVAKPEGHPEVCTASSAALFRSENTPCES